MGLISHQIEMTAEELRGLYIHCPDALFLCCVCGAPLPFVAFGIPEICPDTPGSLRWHVDRLELESMDTCVKRTDNLAGGSTNYCMPCWEMLFAEFTDNIKEALGVSKVRAHESIYRHTTPFARSSYGGVGVVVMLKIV